MADTNLSGLSHKELLKVHCRICGQKRIDGGNNKGVPIRNHPQLCRWLRYLHDVEVERESEEIYPTRVCEGCVNRLRNVAICHPNDRTKKAMENVFELATKLHTECQDDEMRKLAREFPIADFWAHSSSGMCAICDDMQKDTFPILDPRPCLLMEVQIINGTWAISKCERTEKRIQFPKPEKREVKQAGYSTENNKKTAAATKTESSPAKKSRLEIEPVAPKPSISNATTNSPSSSSSSPTPVVYQPPKISSTTAWIQFNDALSRNRKSRCDKFAALLKWCNMDNPKIIQELKNSGIDFKIAANRHSPINVEFKSTLAKCKRILSAFPLQKRMSMLFRSITDTVTDGRTDLTDHVGIKINLNHPNLGFLVRKIKAKQAAAKAENPTRTMPPRSSDPKSKASVQLEHKLPSGITVSKVNTKTEKPSVRGARSASGASSASAASPMTHIKEEPFDGPTGSLLMERVPEMEGNDDLSLAVDQNKVFKAVKVIETKHLPANRQMKTDVVLDLLRIRPDTPGLLSAHGIIYNPKLGKYHLQALHGQRKLHKNAVIKVTEGMKMNKYEWASVMAQIIYGLLHTEDTLTLRVAGIMIDPFHASAPLSFRMGFMLKHVLISQDDPQLSRNLVRQILGACEIEPHQAVNDKPIEDALIQLLYCERSVAKSLLSNTKKPVKIALGKNMLKSGSSSNRPNLNALPAVTRTPYEPVAPAVASTSSGGSNKVGRPRKVIYKDEPLYKEEEEEEEIIPKTTTTRRGRVIVSKTESQIAADDQEYKPKKKFNPNIAAIGATKKAGPKNTKNDAKGGKKIGPASAGTIAAITTPALLRAPRGTRGPYKKSKKQLQKEIALGTLEKNRNNKSYQRKTPSTNPIPWQTHQQLQLQQNIQQNFPSSVSTFESNTIVAIPMTEMMDPLAMPDDNPFDISIKEEPVEEMEGSINTDLGPVSTIIDTTVDQEPPVITDEVSENPIEADDDDDFGGLMITGVTGNVQNLEGDSPVPTISSPYPLGDVAEKIDETSTNDATDDDEAENSAGKNDGNTNKTKKDYITSMSIKAVSSAICDGWSNPVVPPAVDGWTDPPPAPPPSQVEQETTKNPLADKKDINPLADGGDDTNPLGGDNDEASGSTSLQESSSNVVQEPSNGTFALAEVADHQTPSSNEGLLDQDNDTNDDNPYSEESAEHFFGEQNTDTNDNTIEDLPVQQNLDFQQNPQHHNDNNDNEDDSQMNPIEFEPAIMNPTFRGHQSMNHSAQQQQQNQHGHHQESFNSSAHLPNGANFNNGNNANEDDPFTTSHSTNQDTSNNSTTNSTMHAFGNINHNGGSSTNSNTDPFSNSVNHPVFCGNDDVMDSNIDDLLQTNTLENGNNQIPALLDEDANDLLDQLVDFHQSVPSHHTKQHGQGQHEMNHS